MRGSGGGVSTKESHRSQANAHPDKATEQTQLQAPAIRFDRLPARARRLRNLDLAV